MVTGTEIMGGLGAFKAMFDAAKALKDINDAAIRNGAVIELQEKILTAHEAQTALLQRVSELEKEVADFKGWETEKQRYQLKSVGSMSFAYMLKPQARGTEPPHWLCTSCFDKESKGIIQHMMIKGEGFMYACPLCKTTARPNDDVFEDGRPKWLD